MVVSSPDGIGCAGQRQRGTTGIDPNMKPMENLQKFIRDKDKNKNYRLVKKKTQKTRKLADIS